jgi:hypothetical protein
MNKSGVLIFSYTRAQAIADGVLVDVSKLAKEAGFRYPVAVTAAVWAECVTVPDGVAGQDETGRLWDVLNLLRFAIGSKVAVPRYALPGQNLDGERVDFAVHVRKDNSEGDPPLVDLYALCGPGDDGEPVVTIMLPNED